MKRYALSIISLITFLKSGTHLLSHTVTSIVPSAAYVLTIVFGMGTGVSHKRIGTGYSCYKLCVRQKEILMLKACFHKEIFPFWHKRRCRDEESSIPSNACLVTSSSPWWLNSKTTSTHYFLRKEVIQPHLPIRLPCYDFTPVIGSTFDSSLLAVGSLASGISDSHGVTGGVYKTRERIHRSILICDY